MDFCFSGPLRNQQHYFFLTICSLKCTDLVCSITSQVFCHLATSSELHPDVSIPTRKLNRIVNNPKLHSKMAALCFSAVIKVYATHFICHLASFVVSQLAHLPTGPRLRQLWRIIAKNNVVCQSTTTSLDNQQTKSADRENRTTWSQSSVNLRITLN